MCSCSIANDQWRLTKTGFNSRLIKMLSVPRKAVPLTILTWAGSCLGGATMILFARNDTLDVMVLAGSRAGFRMIMNRECYSRRDGHASRSFTPGHMCSSCQSVAPPNSRFPKTRMRSRHDGRQTCTRRRLARPAGQELPPQRLLCTALALIPAARARYQPLVLARYSVSTNTSSSLTGSELKCLRTALASRPLSCRDLVHPPASPPRSRRCCCCCRRPPDRRPRRPAARAAGGSRRSRAPATGCSAPAARCRRRG